MKKSHRIPRFPVWVPVTILLVLVMGVPEVRAQFNPATGTAGNDTVTAQGTFTGSFDGVSGNDNITVQKNAKVTSDQLVLISLESGSVTNRGTLWNGFGASTTVGIQFLGTGSSEGEVLNLGTIRIESATADAKGIRAQSTAQLDVTNDGVIDVRAAGAAMGIEVVSGNLFFSGKGDLTVTGGGATTGINHSASAIMTEIVMGGDFRVTSTGGDATGIFSQAQTLDAWVGGDFRVTGSGTTYGIHHVGTGNMVARVDGNFEVEGATAYGLYNTQGGLDFEGGKNFRVTGTNNVNGAFNAGLGGLLFRTAGDFGVEGGSGSTYGLQNVSGTLDYEGEGDFRVTGTNNVNGVFNAGSGGLLFRTAGDFEVNGGSGTTYGLYNVSGAVDYEGEGDFRVFGADSVYGAFNVGTGGLLFRTAGDFEVEGGSGTTYGLFSVSGTLDYEGGGDFRVYGTDTVYGAFNVGSGGLLFRTAGDFEVQAGSGTTYGLYSVSGALDYEGEGDFRVVGTNGVYGVYSVGSGGLLFRTAGDFEVQGDSGSTYGLQNISGALDYEGEGDFRVVGANGVYGAFNVGSGGLLFRTAGDFEVEGGSGSTYGLQNISGALDYEGEGDFRVSGTSSVNGAYNVGSGGLLFRTMGDFEVVGGTGTTYGLFSVSGASDFEGMGDFRVVGGDSVYGAFNVGSGGLLFRTAGDFEVEGGSGSTYGLFNVSQALDYEGGGDFRVYGTGSAYGAYNVGSGGLQFRTEGNFEVEGGNGGTYGLFSASGGLDYQGGGDFWVISTGSTYGAYNVGSAGLTFRTPGDFEVQGDGGSVYGLFSVSGVLDYEGGGHFRVQGTDTVYGAYNVGSGGLLFRTGGDFDVVGGSGATYGLYSTSGFFDYEGRGNFRVVGDGTTVGMNIASASTVLIDQGGQFEVTGGDSSLAVFVGTASSVDFRNTGTIRHTGGMNSPGIRIQGGTVDFLNTGIIDSTGTDAFAAVDLSGTTLVLTNTGGTINRNLGNAVRINGSTSGTVNLNGISRIGGLIDAPGAADTLNLNLFGVSAADAQALQLTLAGIGSGLGSFSAAGQTYEINGFENINLQTTSFAKLLAGNPGLQDLGRALDHIQGDMDAEFADLLTRLGQASNPEVLFSQLVGQDVIGAMNDLVLSDVRMLSQNMLGRSHALRGGQDGIDTTGLRVTDSSMLASADWIDRRLDGLGLFAGGGGVMSDSPSDQGVRVAPPVRQWGGWVSGQATLADQEDDEGISGYQARSAGTTVGMDYKVMRNLAVGILGGYGHNQVDLTGQGEIEADSAMAGIYAAYAHQGWHLSGLAGYVHTGYELQRDVLGSTADADTNGHTAALHLNGGYDFEAGGWKFGPIGGLQYAHSIIGGYEENGGIIALNVDDQTMDSLQSILGFQVSRTMDLGCVRLMPLVMAKWHHEFLDQGNGTTMRFGNAPGISSFTVDGRDPERDFALIHAGVSAVLPRWDSITFFLGYNGQVGQESYISHQVDGGLRVSF